MRRADDAVQRLIQAIQEQRDAVVAADWPRREAAADRAQEALTDLVVDTVDESLEPSLARAKALLDATIVETRQRVEQHALQLQALARQGRRGVAAKVLDRHG